MDVVKSWLIDKKWQKSINIVYMLKRHTWYKPTFFSKPNAHPTLYYIVLFKEFHLLNSRMQSSSIGRCLVIFMGVSCQLSFHLEKHFFSLLRPIPTITTNNNDTSMLKIAYVTTWPRRAQRISSQNASREVWSCA